MPLTIHNYHPVTKEYLGPSAADPSPLEPDEYLIPAFATAEAPPAVPAGKAAVREADAWALVTDQRGVYWLPDGSPHEILDLGVDRPVEALEAAPVAPAPTIAELRLAAKLDVDGRAEVARLGFITNGAGQALIYEAKRRESEACLANYTAVSPPAAGVYPVLDAEIGITLTAAAQATADAYEVAVAVDAMATAWIAAGAAIETIRLGAKRDLETAADQAAIDAILAGLVWPTP